MNATESSHTRIHLVLNVQEAKWLRTTMQNAYGQNEMGQEDPEDTKQRVAFFEALNELPSIKNI